MLKEQLRAANIIFSSLNMALYKRSCNQVPSGILSKNGQIARILEMSESLVKEYVAIHEEFSKKEEKINDGSKME